MKKGKNIKLERERLKRNLTYQQIADMVHVSKSYYWQIEHNNRNFYYDLAVDIAKIFGKKPDDLFF